MTDEREKELTALLLAFAERIWWQSCLLSMWAERMFLEKQRKS